MQSQPNPGTLGRMASQTFETIMAMLEAELAGIQALKSSMTGAISAAEKSQDAIASALNAQADGMRSAAIGALVGACVGALTTIASAGMQVRGRFGSQLKENQALQNDVLKYKGALAEKPSLDAAGEAVAAPPVRLKAFEDEHVNPHTAKDTRFKDPKSPSEYGVRPDDALVTRALDLADARLKDLKKEERLILQKLEQVTGLLKQAGDASSGASQSVGQMVQADYKANHEVPAEQAKEMLQALKDILSQIKTQFEKVLDAQSRAEEALEQLLKSAMPHA